MAPATESQGLVIIRRGTGDKDRTTLLAEAGRDDLRKQLRDAEALHHLDRRVGLAVVWMPEALDRKYPNAGKEFAWFWVFPSHTLSTDPRAGVVRRHHISDSVVRANCKHTCLLPRTDISRHSDFAICDISPISPLHGYNR